MIELLRANGYEVTLQARGSVLIKPPPPPEWVPELKQNKPKIIEALQAESRVLKPPVKGFGFLDQTPFTESMIKNGLRKWKQPFDECDLNQIETGELGTDKAIQYLYWWANSDRERYSELKQGEKPIQLKPVQCGSCSYYIRTDGHPHLGHCSKGEREDIAGLWDSTLRKCKQHRKLSPIPNIK